MKMVVRTAVAGMAALALTGCSTKVTPVVNSADIQKTDFSQEFQKGQACANYLFGIIGPFGDASLVEAAKNGGISKVEAVDYKSAYYVLLSKQCVVAHGKK